MPPHIRGTIDHVRHRIRPRDTGSALNGQEGRRRLVEELLHNYHPALIIETGTYFGETAQFLARHAPVITVEASPYFHAFARRRFRRTSGVSVVHGDSRRVLEDLCLDRNVPRSGVFFYLDAHPSGLGDLGSLARVLPLAEELDTVLANWEDSIVMVDDFQVPGDPGYGFDDYGGGLTLTLPYLLDHSTEVHRVRPMLFFPRLAAAEETGARRGCLVLASGDRAEQDLLASDLARRHVLAYGGSEQPQSSPR